MPTLYEQLAGLSAIRTSSSSRTTERTLRAATSRPTAADGVAVSEKLIPFGARWYLSDLHSADPSLAALLIRTPDAEVPPVADWCFLDLETTGLAGGTGTYAFLVGIGRVTDEGFHVRQFFLRDLAEERQLLVDLTSILKGSRALVTYNGKQFDAPVLDTRLRLARMPSELDAFVHLDLLYPARLLWKRRWGSAQLSELEQRVLGYERAEDIPGSLIPQLYFDYLRAGDERPLRVVFQHNREDLVTLAALAGRMLQLLTAPESASSDALELFALARLYHRARQDNQASTLYERALCEGLPMDVERAARLRLARLYKRQCYYKRAVRLWRELVDSRAGDFDRESLEAYRELAICYEHRLRDLEAAADATRQALGGLEDVLAVQRRNGLGYHRARAKFNHRLQRLARKSARLSLRPF